MSEQGLASRREAEDLIKRGLVALNGVVVREMGVLIDPTKDVVTILPFAQKEMASKKTVIVHKPRGISSSRIRSEGTSVYDLFPKLAELDVIGRLDKASEGLLMLSDDGVIAKAVTGDAHAIEKEYEVTVREETNAGRLKMLEPGIELEDGLTLPATTHFINKHMFRIVVREGRKHQIRRMCDACHLTIESLIRISIGHLKSAGMKAGNVKRLSDEDVKLLKQG